MDLEKIAKEKWNKEADKFNQWDELGQDEKDELIALAKQATLKKLIRDYKAEVNALKKEINQGTKFVSISVNSSKQIPIEAALSYWKTRLNELVLNGDKMTSGKLESFNY